MLRRSLRLQSNGYYDSEGVRVINYKETLTRIFQRHKTVLPGGGEGTSAINKNDTIKVTDVNTDWYFNLDTNRDDNSCMRSYTIMDSFSYSYTNKNYKNFYSNSYIYKYTNKKTLTTTRVRDRNSVGNIQNVKSNRIDKSRSPSMSKLKMLGIFLILLPLCFTLAFSIPALRSMFSGPSTMNTNSNVGYDRTYGLNVRWLQDELLRLKEFLTTDTDTHRFAVETQGASIVSHPTSDTYKQKPGQTLFGIPLWYPA